jgi:hypothetical protein
MEEYESESEVERRSLSESVSEQMEEYESESISEQMEEYESESESVAASLTPRRMVSADIEDEVVPLAVLAEEGEESANTIQMIDEE